MLPHEIAELDPGVVEGHGALDLEALVEAAKGDGVAPGNDDVLEEEAEDGPVVAYLMPKEVKELTEVGHVANDAVGNFASCVNH